MSTTFHATNRGARAAHRALLPALLGLALVVTAVPADAVDLTVKGVNKDGTITDVTSFRWVLEEDTTYHVQLDGGEVLMDSDGEPVLDPAWKLRQNHTLSLGFHASYAPVVDQGHQGDALPTLDTTTPKHYFISVLPDSGYSIGGAQIAPGQTEVTVYVNQLPLPTAQISVFVFEDNYPTNSAPDTATLALPDGTEQVVEGGLEGFQLILEDAGGRYGASAGQAIQDAFGNPLGTTYIRDANDNPILDADGLPQVDELGSGVIRTDANGYAFVKNMAPGKYGILVAPPSGQGWQQTTTIEGTKVIDAWVKANEPRFFAEFGPPGPHVFMGFVRVDPATKEWTDAASLTGGVSISGTVVNRHLSRPPETQFWPGVTPDHTTAWVALNDLDQGPDGKAVYITETNNGAFTIPNVPDGTYQLAVWDNNLDFVIGLQGITVGPDDPVQPPTCDSAAGPCDLGKVAVNQWFTGLEHDVFLDLNENGFWDAGEPPLLEQNVNLRWRDGTINQAAPTDGEGFVPFDEVFPFFSWQVAEVDFALGKPTGVTVVVDAGGEIDPTDPWSRDGQLNPQIQDPTDPDSYLPGDADGAGGIYPVPPSGTADYRVERGPVLTQAYQGFLGQTSAISWGKTPWKTGENGGISGMVYYATTRAEDDPRWAVAEVWEPGIPGVTINLYRDADLDGIADPGGPILTTVTDSWDASLPSGCVNPADDPFFINNPGVDCFDGLRNFNQVRPGVFDGGYAFGPSFSCADDFGGTCPDWINIPDATNHPDVGYLKPGGYIVEAVTPTGYTLVKEEDRNVDFGDEYTPSTMAVPPVCVNWDDVDEDGVPGRLVPDELSLFPGVEVGSGFGGTSRPLCDRKQVLLSGGSNAPAEFFYFTDVPIAAHYVGFILDDTANEFDPTSVQFGEKYAPPFLPVSFHDWTGREITRTYSDIYGRYNGLIPSTYTTNLPMPSGMSPNMLTACMNSMMKPDGAGGFVRDDLFNPQYSQFCYTFQYMPGTTTYLDTPVVPVAAYAGPGQFPVDCDPQAGTPGILSVTSGTDGPWVPAAGGSLTITSLGVQSVPNPDYCPSSDKSCEDEGLVNDQKTIDRDYGFGTAAGTVTVGGVALDPGFVTWGNDTITVAVPSLATLAADPAFTGWTDKTNNPSWGSGQLLVTNADGVESEVGITVTLGLDTQATHHRVAAGGSIQAAIDAAAPGDLITVAPGTYNEILVMWKPVMLQGWGAGFGGEGSVNVNAIVVPADKLADWRAKVEGLITDGFVDVLPGQEVAAQPGVQPNALGTEQAPGILVLGKRTGNDRFAKNPSRIDGLFVTGSTTGGGILVNAYAGTANNDNAEYALQISNNRVENNAGFFSGGIRLGHPNLVDQNGNELTYADAANRDITIAYNQVFRNGGLEGAGGGISLYNGSGRYRVSNNAVCGNFTLGHGGGIGHLGLSDAGVIEDNTITFNENFNQGPGLNVHGGGLYIGGAPAIVQGELTEGAGNVDVARNLLQGNMAGAGDGGGIALDAVNGSDVGNQPDKWWHVDLVNNTIVNNIAGRAGGGISLRDAVAVRIAHDTVARNDSTATTGDLVVNDASIPQPAGIAAYTHSDAGLPGTFSDPELVDTIVFENRAFNVTTNTDGLLVLEGGAFNDLGVVGTAGAITCNADSCVATGDAGADALFVAPAINTNRLTSMMAEQSLQITAAPDEGGNFIRVVFGIALDTDTTGYGLLSPTGDYHLAAGAVAIDAAVDLDPAVTDDIDGGARFGGTNDIGSDEFGATKAARIPHGAPAARAAGRRVGGGS